MSDRRKWKTWRSILNKIKQSGGEMRSNQIVNYFDKNHPTNLQEEQNLEIKKAAKEDLVTRQTVRNSIDYGKKLGVLKRNDPILDENRKGFNQYEVIYQAIGIFDDELELSEYLQRKLKDHEKEFENVKKRIDLSIENKGIILYDLEIKLRVLESCGDFGIKKFGDKELVKSIQEIRNKKMEFDNYINDKLNESVMEIRNELQLDEILSADEEIRELMS